MASDDYWDGLEGMLDLAAGLAILSDYEPERFVRAMQTRDADECEHLTAVALGLGRVRGWAEDWMQERWNRLRKLRRTPR